MEVTQGGSGVGAGSAGAADELRRGCGSDLRDGRPRNERPSGKAPLRCAAQYHRQPAGTSNLALGEQREIASLHAGLGGTGRFFVGRLTADGRP